MVEHIQDLFIILVEPSDTQLKIITKQFDDLGITNFKTFNSGQELLDNVIELHPDLVISSMHLPDMCSIELVNKLRENEATQDLRFLLISTIKRFDQLDPIKQAGATSVLEKPFNTEQLKSALLTNIDNLDPDQIVLESFDIESLNVLIVDDSRMARRQICKTLAKMGIEKITEAVDGEDALPIIEREYFDLVVTDYNMPNMDGQSLTKYIRTQSNQPSVPILMVTTEENNDRLSEAQEAGVSAICDKPFEPGTVKQMIEEIMAA